MQKLNLTPRQYSGLPGDSRRTKARKRAVATAPQRPEGVVEAARYDRMRAPVWEPAASAPTRPGAHDFQRVESRGLRC